MPGIDSDQKLSLKAIVHDPGNLSYRALLEDTTRRLRIIVEKLDDGS